MLKQAEEKGDPFWQGRPEEGGRGGWREEAQRLDDDDGGRGDGDEDEEEGWRERKDARLFQPQPAYLEGFPGGEGRLGSSCCSSSASPDRGFLRGAPAASRAWPGDRIAAPEGRSGDPASRSLDAGPWRRWLLPRKPTCCTRSRSARRKRRRDRSGRGGGGDRPLPLRDPLLRLGIDWNQGLPSGQNRGVPFHARLLRASPCTARLPWLGGRLRGWGRERKGEPPPPHVYGEGPAWSKGGGSKGPGV